MGRTESQGAQRWGLFCEVCEKHYVHTNLMRRLVVINGKVSTTDTHEIKCMEWKGRVMTSDERMSYQRSGHIPMWLLEKE